MYPLEKDIVVAKQRMSAFSFNALNMILKSQKIDNLIMAGLITSGVVLSTFRQAFDLDYRVFIAQDCCADEDAEVHNFLINKIFPCQAKVLSNTDLEALINSSN